MKNIYIYIILSILLISEAFVLWKNKQQEKEILLKNNNIEHLSTYHYAMERAFKASIENVGKRINGEILTKDTANVAKYLLEIANRASNSILVFRYSDRMCNECVEFSNSIFTVHKDNFDAKNIIFLANNQNLRILKSSISEYGLQDCRVLNCPNLGIPAEEAMFPYIMVVDSSLRVLSVYFPDKSTRGTDYDYKHVKYMYDKLIKEN